MEFNPSVDRAIKVCGVGSLAASFKISPQAVDKWRRNGVPAERVLALEQLSGVSRTELRPDLYPDPAFLKRPAGVTTRRRVGART
jgi:DNA-binding transcriptional regulator YdaS (Cro superfamily)